MGQKIEVLGSFFSIFGKSAHFLAEKGLFASPEANFDVALLSILKVLDLT